MTIDMSQFHAVFLEESAEHLDEIEHLLMAVDADSPDAEQLNSIFRAAHSIKGGAGIFGFDALIAITHVMENLFDKARKGQYQLTSSVVDELLREVDVLRHILQLYGRNDAIDWNMVSQATAKIEQLLKTPESVQDEHAQGFGFFSDQPTSPASADEGFGFFDAPAVSAPTVENTDDDGFGFFEPLETEQGAKHSEAVDVNLAQAEPVVAVMPVVPVVPVVPAPQSVPPKEPAPKIDPSKDSKNKANDESSSIRVDIQKIDGLVNLVGELVITQSMLNLIGEELQGPSAERLQTA